MDTGDNTTSLLLVQTFYDSRGKKNHGFFPFKSLIYLFAVRLDASPPRVNLKLTGTKLFPIYFEIIKSFSYEIILQQLTLY